MQIQVLIRLSQAGAAAERAKPREQQPVWTNSIKTEYGRMLDTGDTPERKTIARALRLTQRTGADSALRLGNFIASTITREPLLVAIAFEAPPDDDAIWNQLAAMASQYADTINPSGMAF